MNTAALAACSGLSLFCLILGACFVCPAGATGQEFLLQPGDFLYKGAFRLPAGEDGWAYGGGGLTYYPPGDPAGDADGYPGSLFGIGNDQRCAISEISIPEPRISATRRPGELNGAATLQPFSEILGAVFTPADDGLPRRADIAYLPLQDGQLTGKLYLTWGEHYQYEQVPSHAWSELDLSHPTVQGPWYLAEYENFATNDYLFEIPERWALQNTPGLRLATGRFRDGSLGGSGPSLFAFGPWNDGNPPAKNARLTHVTPLLLYGKGYEQDGQNRVMRGYTNADEWTGGEWVTAGDRSAILFAGTKGRGTFWYGFSNGVVWPDYPPYPEYPPPPHNDRGWWADSFTGVIVFYNPDDLAKVAAGTMAPHEPQPYAELEVDTYLWHINSPIQKMHLGDMAFDRERDILYLIEPFADGDRPIIHVFAIQRSGIGTAAGSIPSSALTTPPTAQESGSSRPGTVTAGDEPSGNAGIPGPSQAPGFAPGLAVVGIAASFLRQACRR